MHSPSGVEWAALASLLVAVPAVALLAFSGRRHTGAARRAHLILAAGGAVVVGAALAGLLSAVLAHSAAPGDRLHDNALGSAVAVAMALGTATLFAGTLLLPGASETTAAALRHLLDGLVIAAAAWFVGWVLVVGPTRLLGDRTPYGCLPLLLPLGVAVVAGGLTTVLTMRAHRPRHITVQVGAGVTLVAVAATALAGGICQAWTVAILLSAVLLPIGLTAVAAAVRDADRPVAATSDVTRRGTGYAFVPMIAMVVAAGYHVSAGGQFQGMGVAAACVEGLVLVARQYLALGDVRRYADRLREREAHFRELAHTDPLTGLANRRGLLRALREQDAGDGPRALVATDLDGFKNVNDTRGHDVGDEVLAEVGRRLRGNLRPDGVAARLGGDEFAVLIPAGADQARAAAATLLELLSRPYELSTGTVFLSASIGVAAEEERGDATALMRDADLALRAAKQRGKNRVEPYDARYDSSLRRRSILEHELRGAIGRDEFRLVFQPVVTVPTMRPVGGEALLRWRHPELGAVRPDEFIPVAEESGQICEIGAWVLDQACRQLAGWLAAGHDVWVSVNVSPRELHNADYAERVAEVLRRHEVPPQRIVLEVTEHAVATDLAELIRRLTALRETGVRIALDDFGAGYSSLGQLRNLPVDILKIDHALVAEPESRTGTAAPLVDVVVRLGHRLGLEVIAEGIGTPGQRAVVEEAGCRLGQGSLFGWGVPPEHFEAQLRTASSSAARLVPVPPRQRPAVPAGRTARSQFVMIAPGVRQLRALLPTDPGFVDEAGDEPPAQDVRSVDSPDEMRQA
ncbi:putative bifunctional diguanylate cyclase/phosphodiesterase [Spirilliplanes yamanashiensis]|uniref:putative bifunctional diguanylate cyclase/phosphodiesterase n=1 Tax=Spirilliplanes yamanashiensis TaxID=42233 RepID=UPI00277D1E68|nr:diguanylate cyclase (GGDEF)-like protein [Spirilliplanes yamanashiensis]